MHVSGSEQDNEYLFRKYWSEYRKLISWVLNHHFRPVGEDEWQVARIALWIAILSYDETRGMKFSSWLWRILHQQLQEWKGLSAPGMKLPTRAVLSRQFHATLCSLDAETEVAPIEDYEPLKHVPASLCWDGGIGEAERRIDESILCKRLQQALTPNQWYCLSRYLGLGCRHRISQHEIARRLGVRRQAVNNTIRLALKRIRNSPDLLELLLGSDHPSHTTGGVHHVT